MTTVIRAFSALLAVALASAATARAQVPPPPPRDARPASQQAAVIGTAVIAGTVTMAGSTQPARKVRVSLTGGELRSGRSATTDDSGRFSFTALPPGRYNLSANRPGFVSVTYGQPRPGRAGTPIQLADGQKFTANLQLPRGSVITGTVVDENGEPSPQTPVRVMRVVTQNGRRTLQGSNNATTDDRGIYRIFGLLPGDYVVCATPRNNNIGDFDRMRVELQALQQNVEAVSRVTEDEARVVRERITALQGSMPESDEGVPPGYAPVCYPGTLSPSVSAAVTLAVSEERPAIDIQLQLAPLARVEGTVMNSTGAQLREINVSLADAQQAGLSVTNIGARTESDGRFQLPNVPPGQYRLSARATIVPARQADPTSGGRGAAVAGRGAGPGERVEPTTVWASTDITVDGRTLSNVLLTLQNGVSVSGQIAFNGATPPPKDLTRVRVTMSPSEPTPFGGASNGRVDAGGRFTIPGVPPGRYRLTASGVAGWFTDSSAIGAEDALDFPFEVKGNQNLSGAVITFTDKPTEVSGTITDASQQPAPVYTLVVFPADSRYWTGNSRRIQTTRPATDGRFTLRNLPPGEYRIAPVFDLEPGATSDPAFLQQLESTSLRFTLQPGETKTQDIRIGS